MIVKYKTKFDKLFVIGLISFYLALVVFPFLTIKINVAISALLLTTLFIILIIVQTSKLPVFFSAFFLVIVLNFIDNSRTLIVFFYNVLLWIIPAMIGHFLVSNKDLEMNKYLVNFLLIGLCITSFTSILTLIEYPMAARFLASIESESEIGQKYLLSNLGGFDFVYLIVSVYPVVIALFKYKYLNQLFFLTISVLFGTYIYLSQYALAFLVFLFMLLAVALTKKIKLKYLAVVFTVLVLSIFLFSSFYVTLLTYLASKVDSIVIYERIEFLIGILSGANVSGNESISRLDYLISSFRSISRSFVFGTWSIYGNSKSGGHSFILDILVKFGLVGLVSLILMYGSIIKEHYSRLKSEPFFSYLVFSFATSILLSTINPINSLLSITLLTPVAATIMQTQEK